MLTKYLERLVFVYFLKQMAIYTVLQRTCNYFSESKLAILFFLRNGSKLVHRFLVVQEKTGNLQQLPYLPWGLGSFFDFLENINLMYKYWTLMYQTFLTLKVTIDSQVILEPMPEIKMGAIQILFIILPEMVLLYVNSLQRRVESCIGPKDCHRRSITMSFYGFDYFNETQVMKPRFLENVPKSAPALNAKKTEDMRLYKN